MNDAKWDDIPRHGLQNKLRSESLGLTRRDITRLLNVEESTVYRWTKQEFRVETAVPTEFEQLVCGYERTISEIRGTFPDRLSEAFKKIETDYRPGVVINHRDVHFLVPKHNDMVDGVVILGEQVPGLANVPTNLLRVLIGMLLDDLHAGGYGYWTFAREWPSTKGSFHLVDVTESLSAPAA